jgi:hypothetical protein
MPVIASHDDQVQALSYEAAWVCAHQPLFWFQDDSTVVDESIVDDYKTKLEDIICMYPRRPTSVPDPNLMVRMGRPQNMEALSNVQVHNAMKELVRLYIKIKKMKETKRLDEPWETLGLHKITSDFVSENHVDALWFIDFFMISPMVFMEDIISGICNTDSFFKELIRIPDNHNVFRNERELIFRDPINPSIFHWICVIPNHNFCAIVKPFQTRESKIQKRLTLVGAGMGTALLGIHMYNSDYQSVMMDILLGLSLNTTAYMSYQAASEVVPPNTVEIDGTKFVVTGLQPFIQAPDDVNNPEKIFAILTKRVVIHQFTQIQKEWEKILKASAPFVR